MEKHFETQACVSVDVRTMALSLGGDPLTSGILHCTLVRIRTKKIKMSQYCQNKNDFFPCGLPGKSMSETFWNLDPCCQTPGAHGALIGKKLVGLEKI